MRILNFGSLNIDKTYSLDHIVRPGETINSLSYQEFIGGKGLNQSVALAKAGADVYHAGLIGQADGGPLKAQLEDNGVNVCFVESRDFPSGHALIQVDKDGMNCIIVEGGTNRMVDEAFVDKVLQGFEKGDMVLLQNEISSIPYIVDKAYDKGMVIALNPSPMDDLVMEIDLGKISYFLVNEIEGMAISQKDELNEVLDEILRLYPESRTVMTLGGDGAAYRDKDQSFRVEGQRVDVVDTTGAGDTFCGFFLASIAKGMGIEEAMDLANRAAARSCTVKGASNSIPDLADL